MKQKNVYKKRQLLSCFTLSLFVWGIMGTSLGPMIPFLIQHFTLPSAVLGQAFIGWAAGFCIGSLCTTRLIIKISPFIVIVIANILASLFVIGMLIVNSFFIYCLFYSVIGTLGGLLFTTSHTLASYVFFQIDVQHFV